MAVKRNTSEVEILTNYCKMMRSMETDWDNGQPDGPERMMVEATEKVLASLESYARIGTPKYFEILHLTHLRTMEELAE